MNKYKICNTIIWVNEINEKVFSLFYLYCNPYCIFSLYYCNLLINMCFPPIYFHFFFVWILHISFISFLFPNKKLKALFSILFSDLQNISQILLLHDLISLIDSSFTTSVPESPKATESMERTATFDDIVRIIAFYYMDWSKRGTERDYDS